MTFFVSQQTSGSQCTFLSVNKLLQVNELFSQSSNLGKSMNFLVNQQTSGSQQILLSILADRVQARVCAVSTPFREIARSTLKQRKEYKAGQKKFPTEFVCRTLFHLRENVFC